MINTAANQNTKNWYSSVYSEYVKKLNGLSESFLMEIKKESLSKFEQMQFPTNRDEDWKYTSISEILNYQFIPANDNHIKNISEEDINKYLFTGFDFYLMTFVNGLFVDKLSNLQNLPKGVTVGSLKTLIKNNPKLIESYLNKLSKEDNAFNTLNNIYASDGYAVIVNDGVAVDKPIQVLFLNGNDSDLVLSSPKNLIVVGRNSEVKVINNYQGNTSQKYFSNISTEVFVDESGFVDLYKIQNEVENSYHIEKIQAYQKQRSRFNHYNFTFGGSIVRNDINSVLDDENIETHYYGLYLANGNQHIDNHTFVDHAKPNCMSNELYKGIIDDNARGVFNGKIIVRRDAQKTNAYQQNKTVLLSKTARIDTKPQLEIFADDVKCSHGATIGHLDDVANYYIRTRGIPDELAKSMLIRAFANDVVESVNIDPLREQLNHMIFDHLHKVEISN